MARLVDILAKELKVWPEGARSVIYGDHEDLAYFDMGIGYRDALRVGPDVTVDLRGVTAVVTREEWQAAVDALNATKPAEWNGEGLPPVGLKCEMKLDQWSLVEVIAYRNGVAWVDLLDEGRSSLFSNIKDAVFRTVRTPEQIAAEEREKDANEIMSRYINLSEEERGIFGHSPARVMIGLMFAMGYRKQATS